MVGFFLFLVYPYFPMLLQKPVIIKQTKRAQGFHTCPLQVEHTVSKSLLVSLLLYLQTPA